MSDPEQTAKGLRKRNPFSPDLPVEPQRFAGRQAEIRQIKDALDEAVCNNARHILIQGDRWMGKSSLARYAESLAVTRRTTDGKAGDFFVCFCSLGSCCSMEDLCLLILDNFKRTHNSLKDKVLGILAGVGGISIGPIGVTLNRLQAFRVSEMPRILETVITEVSKYYKGVLIILDETERVSCMEGSAHLLKDIVEHLSGNGLRNVCFMMTVTQDCLDSFTRDHASFPRLFRYVSLKTMDGKECGELLEKALQDGWPQTFIDEEAKFMVGNFSDGYPGLIQEIGYCAFQVDTDGNIDSDDVISGISGTYDTKGAIDTLFDKYFRKMLTEDMLSDRYRDILKAASKLTPEFSAAEIKSGIKGCNYQLGGYLANLVKRGVFQKATGLRARYQFCSRMLRLWARLYDVQSEAKRR